MQWFLAGLWKFAALDEVGVPVGHPSAEGLRESRLVGCGLAQDQQDEQFAVAPAAWAEGPPANV
jgi:hypothetical protein